MITLAGSSSWFGGPNDPTTGPKTASGAPTSQPGIAVYNRQTLGGYWAVKMGNNIGLVKQTDIGPAPSTGRSFDYTYSLLPLFGYSQSTFPTGAQTSGVYLGQNLTDVSTHLGSALHQLSASPSQSAALMQAVDVGSFERGYPIVVGPDGKGVSTDPKGTASGSEAIPAGVNLPNPVGDVASVLSDIWGGLTTPALWKRVLYFVGGAFLLFWGLKELTGAEIPAVKLARARAA